jgi:LysR family nitrogen assimilation transcriptional regulator
MELRQLTYFQAVARAASFSRASAELGVAQPALSRQLRKLETELGLDLLYRNGRGVSLTDAGARFLRGVDGILLDLEKLCSDTVAEHGMAHGPVTIGMPPALSGVLAAPLLKRVAVTLPNVQVRIVDAFSGFLHEWLLSRRIDIAVLYNARLSRNISAEHLLSEYLYLIGPGDDVRLPHTGDDATIDFSAIAELPLILPGPNHAMRREVDRAATTAGVKLNVEIEMDALHAIKDLAVEGRYGVLPFGGVYTEVKKGEIKAWRLVRPDAINQMVLAMSAQRPVTLAMRELAHTMQAEIVTLVRGGRLRGILPRELSHADLA